ncbi:hypothetical protein E4P24_02115 [Haloferax sp. AS1]|uniref:hypothetical protein n=1 Tax=Haloferax sp. AS1 TaxID=2562277 RepID=UPI00165F73E6|nr:hypothetical protein [Haloferax sp. AS1]MBC9985168.1 hypothetical protein [Haloferax sp. AS1]
MDHIEITGVRGGPRIEGAGDIPGEFGIEYETVPDLKDKDAREIEEEDLEDSDLDWEQFRPVVDFFELVSGNELVEGVPWYYEIRFEYYGSEPTDLVFKNIEQIQHLNGGSKLSSKSQEETISNVEPGKEYTHQFNRPSPPLDGILQFEFQVSVEGGDSLVIKEPDGSETKTYVPIFRVNENESLRQLYQLAKQGDKDGE